MPSYKFSMKRFGFFILFSLVLTSVFFLSACSNGLGKHEKYVSEYRDNVYVGSNSDFKLEAMSGYREAPFNIDGVSGDKVDFCLVTVSPVNFDPTATYHYKIKLSDVEYEGECVKHPFANTYSFEVAARCLSDSLTVEIDGQSIELASVKSELFITPEKAFEIALKRLNGCDIIENGRYEIYIRLIVNPVNTSGGYFWYVAFVDEEQDICAVLIEPESMEITAVRE